MDKAEFWLRLFMIKEISHKQLRQLATTLGTVEQYGTERLSALPLTPEQQAQFAAPNPLWLQRAQKWLTQPGNQMVIFAEPDYPELLMQISSPPPLLFIRGEVSLLAQSQLAIVGSRDCSPYGAHWGHYFAQVLSSSGLVITSGLALGIDSIAHQGALEVQGKTIAVLGSGLDWIYPWQNKALAEQIVEQGGCLVSEFCPGQPPRAVNFPRRNRIISGLSRGVLVVEASLRSGSLITARYALEQGKEVFALPASLDSEMNAGGHWLIQQGAYLVSQPTDILEQLNSSLHWVSLSLTLPCQNENVVSNAQQELPFAEVFVNVGEEVTPIDMIADKSGQAVPDIVVKLLELELAGWIKAVPGGYVRIRRAGHV
ncbi:MAG: DNA-protecting protein DprA [Enterobacteriaceae bacterium]